MSAVLANKHSRVSLVALLCGVLVVAVLVGCEQDEDGPIGPGEPIAGEFTILDAIFVSSTEITAGDVDTVYARVLGEDGAPYEGAEVSFATSLGRFPNGSKQASEPSDAYGIARTRLITTIADSGKALVEASLSGITRRIAVVVGPRPSTGEPVTVDELTINASPQVVVADGGKSSSAILARALAQGGVPVPGVLVDFRTTAGFIVSPVETNDKGEAVTSLYSPASPAVATVTASAGKETAETSVNFVDPSQLYTLGLSASPEVIRADDGESFSVISARLLDEDRHPVEGAAISFGTDMGFIASSAVTDEEGLATANLHSSSDAGIATVTASFGSVIETIEVAFSPYTPPTPYSLTLTASHTAIPADGGVSSSALTAVVLNEANNPLEGLTVEFETTLGIVAGSAQTDVDGKAKVKLYSSETAGTAQVTASFGTLTDVIQVTMVDTEQFYTIEVSASPDEILADGGESVSTISARLLDEGRSAVEGAEIAFTTNLGSITASGITDEKGLATADLVSGSVSGTATVTASFLDVTGTTQVTFEPYSPDVPESIVLTADPSFLVADGGLTSSTVTAIVLNASNNPMSGVEVEFETTLGIIDRTAVTDAGGAAAVTLHSSLQAGVATVTAAAEDVFETTEVEILSPNEVFAVTVTAAPSAIFADNGNSTAEVTAKLMTTEGNPVEGAPIHFTTTLGSIDDRVDTDAEGEATALLASGTAAGVATVTAMFYDFISAETQVEMLPLDTPVFSIELYASRSQVQVKGTGGVETCKIVAMAYDVLGNPSPDGTEVTFTIVDGPEGDEDIDDAGYGPVTVEVVDGAASVLFRAGSGSGTAIIGATGGGEASDVTAVTIAAGPPAKIGLHPVEPNVSYCYHESNDIVGFVSDARNNPVPDGTAVYFTTDKGRVTASAVTRGEIFEDANGNGQWDEGETFEDEIENGVYDPQGIVRARWTDSGPGPFGVVTITAETSAGSVTGVTTFIASGCPTQVTFLSAEPPSVLADGNSESYVRFQVKDENGLFVKEGTPVFFKTTLGSIDPDTTFTRDGEHGSVALSVLRAPLLSEDYSMPSSTLGDGVGGVATVTGESNFADATGNVTFTTGSASVSESEMISPSKMGTNARAVLNVAIRDFHENPLGGHEIEWVCSQGEFDNGLTTYISYTGETGVAGAIYTSPADTMIVVISARDLDPRGGNLGLNETITVTD
jgi:adhesin/invasin